MLSLSDCLNQVMRQQSLSTDEMMECMGAMMDGAATPAQMAGLLIALRMKGETVAEIAGAAKAMRQRMTRLHINRRPLLDTCGTGGDGASTFNISTAVAFVVAAAGVAVAKHGNRAVSSRSGSADVLAELGVNINAPVDVVEQCINTLGIGFLFAPQLHPAMRHAASVRKELGVRTLFNLLGPLTNPAGATRQLMGVYDRRLVAVLAAVLGTLGSERACVVHGADGLDEISICDQTYVAHWENGRVREEIFEPQMLGLRPASINDLRGGDARDNADLLRAILGGSDTSVRRDAVAINAGMALVVAERVKDLTAGYQHSLEILESGKALALLEDLAAMTRGADA